MTKKQWYEGYTPEDLLNARQNKVAFIIISIPFIIAFITILIVALSI